MSILSVNRVAFNIFGVDIYWYGVIMSIAILVAYITSFALVKIRKLNSNFNFEILIAILPLGIVFARLFAVLFDANLSLLDFFEFRSGGMSIIGAICGGALGLLLLKLIKKRSFWETADLLVVVLILAQGIGRWGNYFNSEIYGQEITNSMWQVFPFAVNINGTFYEALFFYEFVLNILGFIGLIILYKKIQIRGVVTASYFIYYGTVRTILETRRQSEFVLRLGSIPISQMMTIIMIIAGVSLLITVLIKYYKKQKMEKKHG